MIKSRGIKEWDLWHIWEIKEMHTKPRSENLTEILHFVDLDMDGMMILKCILTK
jgi:hypothetical protein